MKEGQNKTKGQFSAELQSLQFNNFLDLPDALLEVEVRQGLTYMNRQAQRLFGYTAKDVADGIEISQLFGKNEYDRAVKIINSYIPENQKRKAEYTPLQEQKLYEFAMRRKDGSIFHAETKTSFVLDGKGVPTGLRTIVRNITKRKLAEEKLQAAHLETERLLSSISLILIGVDPYDQVTRWNERAERTFGIEGEAVLEKPFLDSPIKWNWSEVYVGISECRNKDKTTYLHDIRFARPDGKEGFLDITINPIESDTSGHGGCFLLATEVTERQHLENQLAQAQELESIGLLAAGISHEINTPIQYVGDNTRFLNVAFGKIKTVLDKNSELINAAKEDAVTEELITEVESVIEDTKMEYMLEEIPRSIHETLGGVERVATIVRAMKEFSHPGTQEKKLTDINKALENALTVAGNEWKYVAELVKDFEPTLPVLSCLPSELNQVFLNIIVNAAHAISEVVQNGSKGKGTIKVSTSSTGDWIEIRIGDSGTGIPEVVRSKVFDPFFTTKEIGKGTGQGLAIAHNVVVKKHGGSINFETETGKGTTFVIRLPINA